MGTCRGLPASRCRRLRGWSFQHWKIAHLYEKTSMTREELQQLIRLGEGFTSEFKQDGTTHLGRELCAFANATGGIVLIGVTDDGKPAGMTEADLGKKSIPRNPLLFGMLYRMGA